MNRVTMTIVLLAFAGIALGPSCSGQVQIDNAPIIPSDLPKPIFTYNYDDLAVGQILGSGLAVEESQGVVVCVAMPQTNIAFNLPEGAVDEGQSVTTTVAQSNNVIGACDETVTFKEGITGRRSSCENATGTKGVLAEVSSEGKTISVDIMAKVKYAFDGCNSVSRVGFGFACDMFPPSNGQMYYCNTFGNSSPSTTEVNWETDSSMSDGGWGGVTFTGSPVAKGYPSGGGGCLLSGDWDWQAPGSTVERKCVWTTF